jgi:hypothetical protein
MLLSSLVLFAARVFIVVVGTFAVVWLIRGFAEEKTKIPANGWYAFFQREGETTGKYVPLVCWSIREGRGIPSGRGMVLWPAGDDVGSLAYCDDHPYFAGYFYKPKRE